MNTKRIAAAVALLLVAGTTLAAAPATAPTNTVAFTAVFVESEPFLYTDGMERVTPITVMLYETAPEEIKVYCVGWSISWKCRRNLGQMITYDFTGYLDSNLRLTDGSSPYETVPLAVVVETVTPHQF